MHLPNRDGAGEHQYPRIEAITWPDKGAQAVYIGRTPRLHMEAVMSPYWLSPHGEIGSHEA